MADIGDISYNMTVKAKHSEPEYHMIRKDPSLPPDKMLGVDQADLKAAKDKSILPPLKLRFIEEGPDRTIDENTRYPKQIVMTGISPQETIYELRHAIADQEGIPVEDVNLFSRSTHFEDHLKIGQCYLDYMGSGLDEWPPRFLVKSKVRGFEVCVDVPAMRDTSHWENGRLITWLDRNFIFDCDTSTTITDLKKFITKKIPIPASRLTLTALMRRSLREAGDYVDLEEESLTLSDYDYHLYGVCIKVAKSPFDENGNYVFDDAYTDIDGYREQPADCWLNPDSLSDRTRPGAHKIDPLQPASIVTDRRSADAARQEAEGAH